MTIFAAILLGVLIVDVLAMTVKLRGAQQIKANFAQSSTKPVNIAFSFYGGSGPATDARTDMAIAKFKAGRAEALGFVGGCRPAQGRYGSRDMAARAIAAGIPQDVIFIGKGSYDSHTNMERVRHIMDDQNIQSAAFISDPLHLPRLEALAAPKTVQLWPAPYGTGWLAPISRAQYEVIVDLLRAGLGPARYRAYVKNRRLDLAAIPDKALCNVEATAPVNTDLPQEPRP